MTCEPLLVTSKVSVPDGALAAETLHASSVEVTETVRASPDVADRRPSAFSVQAAKNGVDGQQGGHDQGLAHRFR